MFKWGAPLAVFVLVGILIVVGGWSDPDPPDFLSRSEPASLTEMISEPPSFIYGSSIDVWVYRNQQGEPVEVAVTGHADSTTCRRVSRLLFSTYLQKSPEPRDLLVAGAGWLVSEEDPELRAILEQEEPVPEFIDLRGERAVLGQVRSRAQLAATHGDSNDQSAIEALEARIAELDDRLEALQEDPTVEAYLEESLSGEMLSVLVRESQRIAQDTGLVTVHFSEHSLAEQVRTRIREAVAATERAVISFEDLVGPEESGEAVVLFEALRTRDGSPVRIELPLGELSRDRFEQVRSLNRDDIEHAMIGDAHERRLFYQEKRSSFEREIRRCSSLSPRELAQEVLLTQTCTADGVCFESEPVAMTRQAYCEVRLPLNLKLVDGWLESVDELLEQISADRERKEDSRAERINHMTLVDSMLRDWDLPLARDQSAYDYWRLRRRGAAWQSILDTLEEENLDRSVVSGENVIFSVKAESNLIAVTPVQVVDLRRSIVIVDPDLGATKVVSTWQERRLETAASSGESSADAASEGSPEALESAWRMLLMEDGLGGEFEEAFVQAPVPLFQALMARWTESFPDDSERLEELTAELQPTLAAADFARELARLEFDPQSAEGVFESVRGLRSLLRAFPDAPAEYHLQLALGTAKLLATIHSLDQPDEGLTVDPWDVLGFYSERRSRQSPMSQMLRNMRERLERQYGAPAYDPQDLFESLQKLEPADESMRPDPYLAARTVLASEILEDPADIIRESVQSVRAQDPEYWNAAAREGGMPDRKSSGWQAFDSATEQTLTLFEFEAQQLARARALLQRRGQALSGASKLWRHSIDPGREGDPERMRDTVQAVLEDISAATQRGSVVSDALLISVRDRLADFDRKSADLDTLARIQLGTTIAVGADRLLHRSKEVLSGAGESGGALFRSRSLLAARVQFEMGNYASAWVNLFPEAVSVALYHPEISWEVLTAPLLEGGGGMRAHRGEDGGLVVEAGDGRSYQPVLRMNLPEQEARELEKELNSAGSGIRFVEGLSVADQILALELPLPARLKEVRARFLEPRTRSALIKTMVYGCSPPAADLIPIAGPCLEERESRRRYDALSGAAVIGVTTPELSELKQQASAPKEE